MAHPEKEYVLAALAGVMARGHDPRPLIEKYDLSSSDIRRSACVAIQDIMIGELFRERNAREQVRKLARLARIDDDTIERLAMEVLRGMLFDTQHNTGRNAQFVARNFLRKRLRETPAFGYTGLINAWEPKEQQRGLGGDNELQTSLAFHEELHAEHTTSPGIPEPYQELIGAALECRNRKL